jgi:hypothetical protein
VAGFGHSTATVSDGEQLLVTDAAFKFTLGSAETQAVMDSNGTQPVVFELPTHCEPSVSLVEPLVLDLNPDSWNKPFTLSAEQLSELNLPTGESNVTVTLNLSNLLGAEAAPTQLTATGTLHEGQAFTYHADATLQAMIDQQQMAMS